eukprot:3952518-Lingulodinium_polyedra.AAC.1
MVTGLQGFGKWTTAAESHTRGDWWATVALSATGQYATARECAHRWTASEGIPSMPDARKGRVARMASPS